MHVTVFYGVCVCVFVMECISFRHGKMYLYDLMSVMSVESLVSFADGWYVNAQSMPVPPEPTPL